MGEVRVLSGKKNRRPAIVLLSAIILLVLLTTGALVGGIYIGKRGGDLGPLQKQLNTLREDLDALELAYNNVKADLDVTAEDLVTREAEVKALEDKYQWLLTQQQEQKAGVMTIYLTFDDGPSATHTAKVLDILKAKGVKATFFMCGNKIAGNKAMARRVYEEGHTLANHSYSHEYKKLYKTADSFFDEFDRTNKLIKEITGEDCKLFRFPGGSNTGFIPKAVLPKIKEGLKERGVTYFDWNVSTGDATGKTPQPGEIYNRVINQVASLKKRSGRSAVVLAHDIKKYTGEELEQMIDKLLAEGCVFGTLKTASYAPQFK